MVLRILYVRGIILSSIRSETLSQWRDFRIEVICWNFGAWSKSILYVLETIYLIFQKKYSTESCSNQACNHAQQLVTTQIRPHIEYLTRTYNILVLIGENSILTDGFQYDLMMILDSGLLAGPPCGVLSSSPEGMDHSTPQKNLHHPWKDTVYIGPFLIFRKQSIIFVLCSWWLAACFGQAQSHVSNGLRWLPRLFRQPTQAVISHIGGFQFELVLNAIVSTTVWPFLVTSRVAQKLTPFCTPYNFINWSIFKLFFTMRIRRKFVIILSQIPPHLKCVATLPCEISVS